MTLCIASIGDLSVFQALDTASKATDQLSKQLDIDKLQDIQDRIADQMAEQEERSEFFVNAGKVAGADEDDLMDELEQMEADMAAQELENVEIGSGAVKGSGGMEAIHSGGIPQPVGK